MSDPRDTTRPPHLEVVPPPNDNEGPGTPPPHDYNTERIVLGSILLDKIALAEVTETLNPGDFWHPAHTTIYQACIDLYARTQPVELDAVAIHLGPNLVRAGGRAYLHQLIAAVAIPASAGYYADQLAELAATRRLIEHHQRGLQNAYLARTPATDLITLARTDLDSIALGVPGVDHATTNTWAPVDLADILTGDLSTPRATLLHRRDGKHLLYPYAVHSVSGEPGSGKTWVALVAIAQALDDNQDALFIDFEDRPQTIVARLRALGVPDQHMIDHLHYIRPETALDPTSRTQLEALAQGATIAVIDGITEAMTMHGLSLMDNEDVARWLALVPNLLAKHGPAVLQIDHVVKNAESRGRYAIGGQHKLAGITGTAYKMLTVQSFGQGTKGHAKLVLDKDKHGDVGPSGITAADLHMDATNPDGTLYAWLDAPERSTDEDGHFRPTTLMERVSTYLLATPGASSLNDIKRGVKGKAESIADAVDALIREGNIRIETGPRGTQMHYLVEAFGADS
jgi:hypothetical protein